MTVGVGIGATARCITSLPIPPEIAIVDGLKLSMYGGKKTITALVFWPRTCEVFFEHG